MIDYYKRLYEFNLMSKNNLAIAVALNDDSLTADDYKTITGEDYVAPVVTSVIKDLQTDLLNTKTVLEKTKISVSLGTGLLTDRVEYVESDVETLKGGV